MKYFDANAMIGAHFAPCEGKFFEAGDLLEEMDFFGIDEALVYHGMAREYDFNIGNKKLMKCIAQTSRLHPCWVIGLHHTGSISSPKELTKSALENGVKAMRLYFGGRLSDSAIIDVLSYKELFAELEKHCFPTLIEFENSPQMSAEQVMQINDVLEVFPELPIILSMPKMGIELRLVYPRMDRYKNLYIEISGLHSNHIIEEMVKKFGHRRLIFGTHFPWFGAGQVKIALAYADISQEEREGIAYKNLQILIKGIRG